MPLIKFLTLILAVLLSLSPAFGASPKQARKTLEGLTICVDPGRGGTAETDNWRVGPTGERAEWINLRVALALQILLEEAGVNVLLTRTEDVAVYLKDRAKKAIENNADLFISIHHFTPKEDSFPPEGETNHPFLFFHGEEAENPASFQLGELILKEFKKKLKFKKGEIYSDLLFNENGAAVLRYTSPFMPGVIGEAGFLSNPEHEAKLKTSEYNQKEAQAYFDGIYRYFRKKPPKAEFIFPGSIPYYKEIINFKNNYFFIRLHDGLGGHKFKKDSLKLVIDNKVVGFSYVVNSGLLLPEKIWLDFGQHEARVFGKNKKGAFLHPKTVTFTVENLPQAINPYRQEVKEIE